MTTPTKTPIFPTAAHALHFGAGRMETIIRVAWLPVVLLLIVNMATLFGYVSVMAERLVTFEEAVPTFRALERIGAQAAEAGWDKNPRAMSAITAASLSLQFILISAFMAPLIRLAGLGERPGPGLFRIPFGPDQIRFALATIASFFAIGALVLGPMALVTDATASYVADALSETLAYFPDEASLHTIELVTRQDLIAESGAQWIYDLAIPLSVAAPVFIAFWGLLLFHFRPTQSGTSARWAVRALSTFVGAVLVTALFSVYVTISAGLAFERSIAGFAFLTAAFIALFYYLQLRAAPYTGVVVCRRSMAPGPSLSVTRRWDIVRVLAIIVLLTALLFAIQFVINEYVLGRWIAAAVNQMYVAAESYAVLLSGGDGAGWVLPTFAWIWNITKILINIFWMLFSYGVVAGLFGDLYRQSAGLGPGAAAV